jgi:hypothetical protein
VQEMWLLDMYTLSSDMASALRYVVNLKTVPALLKSVEDVI